MRNAAKKNFKNSETKVIMQYTKNKTRLEIANSAVLNLANKGIDARVDECDITVYVSVNDLEVEISDYEMNFQAREYDEIIH